jgi:L-glyceraldehyde 3-phosphate reductase
MPFAAPYVPDAGRYDGRMPYRRCGRSGLVLPAVSLGLWQNFGGADMFETGRAILRRDSVTAPRR